MNWAQVVLRFRSGAGPSPCRLRILPTVWSETRCPRLANAPTMRSWPQLGFWRANWSTNCSTSAGTNGRPGLTFRRAGKIPLVGDQPAMPFEQGFGLTDGNDVV